MFPLYFPPYTLPLSNFTRHLASPCPSTLCSHTPHLASSPARIPYIFPLISAFYLLSPLLAHLPYQLLLSHLSSLISPLITSSPTSPYLPPSCPFPTHLLHFTPLLPRLHLPICVSSLNYLHPPLSASVPYLPHNHTPLSSTLIHLFNLTHIAFPSLHSLPSSQVTSLHLLFLLTSSLLSHLPFTCTHSYISLICTQACIRTPFTFVHVHMHIHTA